MFVKALPYVDIWRHWGSFLEQNSLPFAGLFKPGNPESILSSQGTRSILTAARIRQQGGRISLSCLCNLRDLVDAAWARRQSLPVTGFHDS
jgi:hypothetical protein